MLRAILFDWFGVVCNKAYLEWVTDNVSDEGRIAALEAIADRLDSGEIGLDQFHQEVSVVSGKTVAEVRIGIRSQVRVDLEVIEGTSESVSCRT